MVRANGAVSLRELARVVQTSEVTVRRDVRALEAEGLLDRRHGGAVLPGGFTRESGFPQKSHLATAEKTAIADVAASLVEEGEAVVVGAGTTTQELARRLARVPGLTVVTNSLLVAQALAHANRVEVVMTGGTLRGSNYALVGSGAEQSLQGLRVSRAFLSGSGLTAERGLSTSNMLSASVDRALVQAAAEVVVLADHTKLGTDTMFQTVPTDVMTRLVTDEPPPHDDRAATELQALADQGVQITVAGAAAASGGDGMHPRRPRRDSPSRSSAGAARRPNSAARPPVGPGRTGTGEGGGHAAAVTRRRLGRAPEGREALPETGRASIRTGPTAKIRWGRCAVPAPLLAAHASKYRHDGVAAHLDDATVILNDDDEPSGRRYDEHVGPHGVVADASVERLDEIAEIRGFDEIRTLIRVEARAVHHDEGAFEVVAVRQEVILDGIGVAFCEVERPPVVEGNAGHSVRVVCRRSGEDRIQYPFREVPVDVPRCCGHRLPIGEGSAPKIRLPHKEVVQTAAGEVGGDLQEIIFIGHEEALYHWRQ